MNQLKMDSEKLAWGLEKGIGKTRTFFADLDPEFRLRISACGLVSSAIHVYAASLGIDSQLQIGSDLTPIDRGMRHVVPVFDYESADPRFVDGTYSQFFQYVGLRVGYVKRVHAPAYPNEKIVDVRFSERDLLADWMADIADVFRSRCRSVTDMWGSELHIGPLAAEPKHTIRQTYERIWDPARYQPWVPPDYVLEDGSTVSRHIPKGAILSA